MTVESCASSTVERCKPIPAVCNTRALVSYGALQQFWRPTGEAAANPFGEGIGLLILQKAPLFPKLVHSAFAQHRVPVELSLMHLCCAHLPIKPGSGLLAAWVGRPQI